MAYKRQIAYVDLIENEIKRGNAGFIKWEKYDECHILSVFINGVEGIYSKEANVEMEDGHSIGKINICHGRGEGTYLLARDEKDWVEEISAIRIIIGPGRELVAEYESVQMPIVEVGKEMPVFEEIKEKIFSESEHNLDAPLKLEEPETEEDLEAGEEALIEETVIEETVIEGIGAPEPEEEPEQFSFWEEMGKTHELFYPFENNIGCYRMFPKDINRFHANYHMLQNNQFLMHGYYNYRHLIIFPKKDADGEYWLGVPGIYHEREKMAARMYGFEKFEGTKKEYRVGDMGYYLITVEC